MEYFKFTDKNLSRVFKGNWQLSGGHGTVDRQQAVEDLFTYAEHGVNVFDAGDIYGDAEEILGIFLQEYVDKFGKNAAEKLRFHTKFIPDLDALDDLTESDMRRVIQRSLKRLGLERLHLVQFHWWDFGKGDFVQAARYLDELRQKGLIETIGLTNFDVEHTQQLLDAGIPIKSNQIQFSLLDPRPLNGMLEFAQKNDIALFCYGTLAGGLLGSKKSGDEPSNRSHTKYQLIIEEAGIEYYEKATELLNSMAAKYATSPANIAALYALQTAGVSSVIVGPRNTSHISELDELGSINLDSDDYDTLRKLQEVLRETNHDDIYSYERDRSGPHGRIMKYNLHGMRS